MTRVQIVTGLGARLAVFFAIAGAWYPASAGAAGLRISPVRLDMSASAPSTQVNLTNLGPTDVAVQVRAYQWRQEAGEDRYELTKDIFFAPPIVTVPAAGQVSVRLRLRAKAPDQAEGSYRVYFQELPPADSASQGAGTTLRVRFGIPLFVRPSMPAAPKLEVRTSLLAGQLLAEFRNVGTEHLKIEGVDIFPASVNRADATAVAVASAGQSAKGVSYLLPGSQLDWSIPVAAGFTAAGHVLRIRTDDRSGRPGTGISRDGWSWKSLEAPSPATSSGSKPKP